MNTSAITYRQRVDKALHSLKGILAGIALDKSVNEVELAELRAWLQAHEELALKNPFKEFADSVGYMLSGTIPIADIVADISWLADKYAAGTTYFDLVTHDLQTLHGLCHGILADGIVNDQEVFGLEKWLNEHRHLINYGNDIFGCTD